VALHHKGLAHGDAQLHNFIVCPSPLEILIVDFESSVVRSAVTQDAWKKITGEDVAPLLRECALLLCCLGAQPGLLAEMATDNLGRIFSAPDRIRREIDERAPKPG